MKYVTLAGTNLSVSQITLGTWAIGGTHWGVHDNTLAARAVKTAIDLGINIIDTAPAYGAGHAEELIGKAIRKRRDQVIIATKCGLDIENGYRNNLSPEYMEYELNQSLKRLKTEYIDIYQCHWPDPNTPIEKSMEAMLRFKDQGKIRFIGVSNFDGPLIVETLKYARIVTLQPHYSLLERNIERSIQDICIENDISIIPYASLGGGMLTGKYTTAPAFKKDDARSFFYKFFQKKYWPGVKALLAAMAELAAEKNAKHSHIAIAWLLAKPGVRTVLAGARTPQQVKDNIGGVDVTLQRDEMARLDRLSAQVYQ